MLIVLAAVAVVVLQGPTAAGEEPTPTGETTEKVVYVVIVPPEDGKRQCRIVPDPRVVEKTQSLAFVNLSGEKIKIELKKELVGGSDPTLVFHLVKDESRAVPLVDPKPGEYIYSIKGPSGGCLTDLPTPKIVIP
jgi:hypothetical protein